MAFPLSCLTFLTGLRFLQPDKALSFSGEKFPTPLWPLRQSETYYWRRTTILHEEAQSTRTLSIFLYFPRTTPPTPLCRKCLQPFSDLGTPFKNFQRPFEEPRSQCNSSRRENVWGKSAVGGLIETTRPTVDKLCGNKQSSALTLALLSKNAPQCHYHQCSGMANILGRASCLKSGKAVSPH